MKTYDLERDWSTTVYLASPANQQQAEHCSGVPVLMSYALWSSWMERYQASWKRILIDSGAYSELTSGKVIDLAAYADFAKRWEGHADAIAGLDDIGGNWRRSLKNYEVVGFPTIHDSDPPELLKDLIPIARERGRWLGIGLVPPRENKEHFLRQVLDNVPEDLHIHGFALRRYAYLRRIDSFDSTNWWRDALQLANSFTWLTPGECLRLVVKRYIREPRLVEKGRKGLFDLSVPVEGVDLDD